MTVTHGTFTGDMPVTLAQSGLPAGVTFTDNGNGSFSLDGNFPAPPGEYLYTVTATNAYGTVSVPNNKIISTASGGAGEISLSNTSVLSSDENPNFANARYQISADGFVKTATVDGAALANFEQWCAGTPSDYEVRATLLSGDVPFGTMDAWLSGGVDHLWRLRTPNGNLASTILFEIRDVATSTIQDSATVYLEAIGIA